MFLNRTTLAITLNHKPIIGFTSSAFDLLHAGHMVMLQEAREKCDYLIVGLLVDPTVDRPDTKNAPIQSVAERYLQLSGCKYVNEVIPFQTERDLIDLILTINPDIRFVGEEYRDKNHTGVGLCPIFYNSRRHTFSSTELRSRIEKTISKKVV